MASEKAAGYCAKTEGEWAPSSSRAVVTTTGRCPLSNPPDGTYIRVTRCNAPIKYLVGEMCL